MSANKKSKPSEKAVASSEWLDILDQLEHSENARWQVAMENLKAVHDTPEFMSWAAKRHWAIERELVRADAAMDTIKLLRHICKMSND